VDQVYLLPNSVFPLAMSVSASSSIITAGLRLTTAGIHVDQANEGGWQIPSNSLPSLALNPRPKSATGGAKPKLSLSGFSSPAPTPTPSYTQSPMAVPSIPSRRPPLLNAPSASQTPSRSLTPSLKLAIPGLQSGAVSGGSGFTSAHGYPDEDDFSDLRTPMAGDAEDRNPTILARGGDDGESSYGYGRINNGLGDSGDRMSAMTHDIRQALANRSRFDPTPQQSYSGSSRSRASSRTNSAANSRRSSGVATPQPDDLTALQNLTISQEAGQIGSAGPDSADGHGSVYSRHSDDEANQGIPIINPADLTLIRRLGEGAGGSVDLVRDKQGKIMAKKVRIVFLKTVLH
jgi:mitogen-activated protein kinase kinase